MTTNFPEKGDDKKISLRNSNFPQFDYKFAKAMKDNTPKIWRAGGNIRGNEAYEFWTKARNGQETEGVTKWIEMVNNLKMIQPYSQICQMLLEL